jgi:hypothetical protein
MRAWISLGLALTMAAGAAGARGAPHAKRPDLSGLWSTASLTSEERDDAFKTLTVNPADAAAYEKKHRGRPPEDPDDTVGGGDSEWWETDVGLARIRGQIRTSWIVSPADGKRPMTAQAQAFGKARRERRKVDFDNPEGRMGSERCVESGAIPPLENGGYDDNYQFVQTGEALLIYAEWMTTWRIVRIGDTHHLPSGLRVPGGDSIAHWEGETLVIETTNFLPREVDAPNGDATADMRIFERLTRLSPTELGYAFSVTNPARYTQTWMGEVAFHPANGAIYEFACHEGNYGLTNMLAGARHAEATAVAATPAK